MQMRHYCWSAHCKSYENTFRSERQKQ